MWVRVGSLVAFCHGADIAQCSIVRLNLSTIMIPEKHMAAPDNCPSHHQRERYDVSNLSEYVLDCDSSRTYVWVEIYNVNESENHLLYCKSCIWCASWRRCINKVQRVTPLFFFSRVLSYSTSIAYQLFIHPRSHLNTNRGHYLLYCLIIGPRRLHTPTIIVMTLSSARISASSVT